MRGYDVRSIFKPARAQTIKRLGDSIKKTARALTRPPHGMLLVAAAALVFTHCVELHLAPAHRKVFNPPARSEDILRGATWLSTLPVDHSDRVVAGVLDVGGRYFFDRDAEDRWLAAVALLTRVRGDSLTLAEPSSLGRAVRAVCQWEASPVRLAGATHRKNSDTSTRAAIKPATVRGQKPLTKEAIAAGRRMAAEQAFARSLGGYLKTLNLYACYASILSETAAAARLPVMPGLMSAPTSEKTTSFVLSLKNLKPAYVIPSAGADALSLKIASHQFITRYGALFGAAVDPAESAARRNGFYDERVLRTFFKGRLFLSDVMATTYAKTAVAAARAFQLTDAEAWAWVSTAATARDLGLSTVGRGMIPPLAATPAFAARCGLDDVTSDELAQSSVGLMISACAWSAHRAATPSVLETVVSFFNRTPKTIHDRKPAGAVEAAPTLVLAGGAWRSAETTPGAELDLNRATDFDRIMVLMEIVKTPLSEAQRARTADMITAVATAVLSSEQERRDWYVVLAIESKFVNGLVSPTGARGYGQLIPSYYADFGRGCQFDDTRREDIEDGGANLMLSACYLKLIQESRPYISQALVAYNAGPNSKDLRTFTNLGSIGLEPANYVSRYQLIREMLDARERSSRVSALGGAVSQPRT